MPVCVRCTLAVRGGLSTLSGVETGVFCSGCPWGPVAGGGGACCACAHQPGTAVSDATYAPGPPPPPGFYLLFPTEPEATPPAACLPACPLLPPHSTTTRHHHAPRHVWATAHKHTPGRGLLCAGGAACTHVNDGQRRAAAFLSWHNPLFMVAAWDYVPGATCWHFPRTSPLRGHVTPQPPPPRTTPARPTHRVLAGAGMVCVWGGGDSPVARKTLASCRESTAGPSFAACSAHGPPGGLACWVAGPAGGGAGWGGGRGAGAGAGAGLQGRGTPPSAARGTQVPVARYLRGTHMVMLFLLISHSLLSPPMQPGKPLLQSVVRRPASEQHVPRTLRHREVLGRSCSGRPSGQGCVQPCPNRRRAATANA